MKRLSIVVLALLARLRSQRPGSAGHRSVHGRRCGAGIRWTLGLGAVAFPDYQGSSDYTAAPLWNVRAQNLYHPDTYVQLFGPIFTSNLIPDCDFRLGPMAQYIGKRGSVRQQHGRRPEECRPVVHAGCHCRLRLQVGREPRPRNRIPRPAGRSQRQRLPGYPAGNLQGAPRRELARGDRASRPPGPATTT